MDFERGKDPKETIGIGIRETLVDIIRGRLYGDGDFEDPTDGMLVRKTIIKDIIKYTGWEEVHDITSYDHPYLLKFQHNDKKNNKIIIYTIDTKKIYNEI